MISDAVAALGESLCMNVRSFRKDGMPIDTPVWVVALDGGLAFFTDERSFKCKRLRRNPRIEVAPCDVWGKVSDEWRPGVCHVVEDPARKQRIFDLIAQKYGIHWTMSTLGKRLLRQLHHRVVFELAIDNPERVVNDPERASALGGAGPGAGNAGPVVGNASPALGARASSGGSGPALVEASDVHKVYKRGRAGVNAVRGVSLRVTAGEMVAIVGPSGSGKSTLLNLLGALDRPSSGEIMIDGARLSALDDTARTLLRLHKIGFVFQFFNLLPLLNARENVALPLLLAGTPRAEAERRADELLDRVGLQARAEHTPDELSGGEMQRVAVARALSTRPVLLLADEPTGNLDTESGTGVLALLRSATREDGCAVIMVTHDPRAAAVADRVIEFGDGKLVSERVQIAHAESSAAGPTREAV